MKKVFCFLPFLFLLGQAGFAQGQMAVLEGFVFESQTQKRLEGVNVIVEGTGQGDATDLTGYFIIEDVPPGEYQVKFKLIGYLEHQETVRLEAGKTHTLDVDLSSRILEGSEVTVEGERNEDLRLKISRPSFQLQPPEVRALPGGLEDVMRSLQTLPGVLATSDYSNQFVVRGGGPDQNLILLDDVEIYNPYRGSGMPSLINPAIVHNVNLYAGAYPVIFGDRLSSVLSVHTRDGTTAEWLAGQLGVNLIDASFVLEGKLPHWQGSWLLSSRRTHEYLFAESWAERLTPNEVALPDFEDWHAEIVLRPRPKHRVQLHGFYGKNNQDWLVKEQIGEQGSDREELDGKDQLDNLAVGLSWSYLPARNAQMKAYANWYKNSGKTSFASDLIPNNDSAALGPAFNPTPPPFGVADTATFAYNQDFDFRRFSAGAWFVQETNKHTLEAGFGFDYLDNSINSGLALNDFGEVVFRALRSAPNWFGAIADSIDQTSSYRRMHFYLQDKIQLLGNKMYLQPGLRFDLFGVSEQAVLSPRLKAGYLLDPVTEITAAAGIFHQSPGYEKLLDGGAVFDALRFSVLDRVSAERAVHAVIGANRWLNDQWQVRVEGYYKKYFDLIGQAVVAANRAAGAYTSGPPALTSSYSVVERLGFASIPVPENNVDGRAYGVDFILEKKHTDPSDRFHGWVAYAFANSTREQNIAGERVSFPYEFDRRHTVNAVVNYRIGPIHLGLTWQFGTGFPFTPARRVEPLIAVVMPDSTTVTNVVFEDPETGYARFVPSFGGAENTNSARLPDYHRLDARIAYSTNLLNSRWNFYVDFINIYDRKNVLFFRNIIEIEGDDENLPPALRFPKPVLLREPVYMYPFIPSFGVEVAF